MTHISTGSGLELPTLILQDLILTVNLPDHYIRHITRAISRRIHKQLVNIRQCVRVGMCRNV